MVRFDGCLSDAYTGAVLGKGETKYFFLVWSLEGIRIWDYVLSVCDWVCVHNFKPEVFLFESTSALNLSCPKISQRYLSGSPMCLASHGKIDVMLMRTLTKTFLARKQNIPGLKMRGSEIGDWRFWNLKLFPYAYSSCPPVQGTPWSQVNPTLPPDYQTNPVSRPTNGAARYLMLMHQTSEKWPPANNLRFSSFWFAL